MEFKEQENRFKVYFHLILVSFISLIHFVSFEYGSTKSENPTVVESFFTELLTPVQLGLSNGQDLFKFYLDRYVNILGTKAEIEKLRKENNELLIEVKGLEYFKEENLRLKALVNFSKDIEYKKVLARVVSLGNSGHYYSLKLNKGTKEGVHKNSVVINSQGLVGIVTQVTRNYAEVSTLLDFSNRVDILSVRSRVHGILRGDANQTCAMTYIKTDEDILKGDLLQTSGMGEVYPKGIHVGEVLEVQSNESELTKVVKVKPFVDFSKLEEVIVFIQVAGENENKINSL